MAGEGGKRDFRGEEQNPGETVEMWAEEQPGVRHLPAEQPGLGQGHTVSQEEALSSWLCP